MKIVLKNIKKEYKKNIILEDVNIEFEDGNIYGFIGRNGSGKSLLLKLICGFIVPTAGQIIYDDKILNKDIVVPPSTRCLIERPQFIPTLSGYKNLELIANIKKIITKEEIERALKNVGLYEEKDKKYYKYSLGMKQKLGIAQVLMENPKIIILDEPFNGIDYESVNKIKKLLVEEKEKGKIIIISSHIKEDINELSNKIFEFDNCKVKEVK